MNFVGLSQCIVYLLMPVLLSILLTSLMNIRVQGRRNGCVKDSVPDKKGGANSARIALPVRAG